MLSVDELNLHYKSLIDRIYEFKPTLGSKDRGKTLKGHTERTSGLVVFATSASLTGNRFYNSTLTVLILDSWHYSETPALSKGGASTPMRISRKVHSKSPRLAIERMM